MVQLPDTYNTEDNNEQMADFTAIPTGKYIAIIVKSEMKTTRDQTGNYLKLELKIIDGKHKGRIVFDMLNLVNQNSQTMQIANNILNTICNACGKVSVQDSLELHNIPMNITVGIKPATNTYDASNIVKHYAKYDNATAMTEDLNKNTSSRVPWE